jgi:hypothetical protein
MTTRSTAMADSSHFNTQDSQLIANLHRISKASPKLIRSTLYDAPSDPAIKVRSWKMNEFKYYDVPSPFPTLARGLVTRELEKGKDGDEPRYQIVARGYDKFFNIGEVPWTDVSGSPAVGKGCVVLIGPAPSTCYFPAFDRMIVAVFGSAYGPKLHVIRKVKRMHHLHRAYIFI